MISSDDLQSIFYLLIICGFILDQTLDYLNLKNFPSKAPALLREVYSDSHLRKTRLYQKSLWSFGALESFLSLIVILVFIATGFLGWLDQKIYSMIDNQVWQSVLFFAVIFIGSVVLSLPFSWYYTFTIEERFGFNRTTLKTFISDRVKSIFLAALIGIPLLAFTTYLFLKSGSWFWIIAWLVISLLSILFSIFYNDLIVPLFNRQTPLPDGELRESIEKLAETSGFKVKNVYMIDGSKRSTKANAYFTGFGPRKRIVLYDTLVRDYTNDEILAVLAHEMGHYRHRHTLKGMILSLIQTGLMLYLLSLFIAPGSEISVALCKAIGGEGVTHSSFHLGLLGFAIIYEPVSFITGLIFNAFSRKFEFQADRYAVDLSLGEPLKTALKKLSSSHLSHPSPHPWYVAVHYSHPPLLHRLQAIEAAQQIL